MEIKNILFGIILALMLCSFSSAKTIGATTISSNGINITAYTDGTFTEVGNVYECFMQCDVYKFTDCDCDVWKRCGCNL